MNNIRIVAIVGSLRKHSYNLQLASAAKDITSDRADFEILEFSDIPFMNQDIEYPAPPAIKRIRNLIQKADGVWFFTPEYNHSFPGVLKNLIDWLSRPISKKEGQVLKRKPAAISGISPGMTGTISAQDHLVTLISLLNMDVMNRPRLTIPNASELTDSNGILNMQTILPRLKKQSDVFIKFIETRMK